VSINLNGNFEGGEVRFPEYSSKGFKVPAGCAVVFSCSLLHAVSRVTAGRRYAFLPFVYDEAAARIRQQNRSFLERPQQNAQVSL
jgi:predicted 2-oxoglutarate/Fe(II)-dependent dioxygenase YbiX